MMNPFRPTAGATPPELIGREGTLDEFEYGLRIGSGAPGLLTIITGTRGIGKTALLSAAQDKAAEQGWVVSPRDRDSRIRRPDRGNDESPPG